MKKKLKSVLNQTVRFGQQCVRNERMKPNLTKEVMKYLLQHLLMLCILLH